MHSFQMTAKRGTEMMQIRRKRFTLFSLLRGQLPPRGSLSARLRAGDRRNRITSFHLSVLLLRRKTPPLKGRLSTGGGIRVAVTTERLTLRGAGLPIGQD